MVNKPLTLTDVSSVDEDEHEQLRVVNLDRYRAGCEAWVSPSRRADRRHRAVERSQARVHYK